MLAIIYLKNGEIGEGGEEREILRAFKSLLKKNKNLRNSFRRIFIHETTSILSSVLYFRTGRREVKNLF